MSEHSSIIPLDPRGNVEVILQDQFTPALDLYFIKSLGANSLAVQTTPNDLSITLNDATGFIANDWIGIFSPEGIFYFGTQLGAPAGNVITLDTPIDKVFVVGANVIRATKNMVVDGSVTPQIFQVGPVGLTTATKIDITRIMGYIQSESAMDDSLFGSVSALTNGVVLRHNNDVIDNLWNVKTNGDIGLICFDSTSSNRAPAGSFGFRFRNTYAGSAKHGVTLRLEPGDILEAIVQDELNNASDKMELFHLMAQGHIVE